MTQKVFQSALVTGCDGLACLYRCEGSIQAEPGAKWDRGSGSGLLVPAEDTHRPQRIPPAGATVAVLECKVDRAGMRVLQQPGAIGLLYAEVVIRRPEAWLPSFLLVEADVANRLLAVGIGEIRPDGPVHIIEEIL
jgi:hypothetical protein